MARIKLNDLPKDMDLSKEDMKKAMGGALVAPFSRPRSSIIPTGPPPDGLVFDPTKPTLPTAGESIAGLLNDYSSDS